MQCLAIACKKVQWLQCVYVVVLVCTWSATATDAAFENFKNRDVLATRTMPDLAALNYVHFADHKNDYLNKLLAAWEQLNFDRSYISRGN